MMQTYTKLSKNKSNKINVLMETKRHISIAFSFQLTIIWYFSCLVCPFYIHLAETLN